MTNTSSFNGFDNFVRNAYRAVISDRYYGSAVLFSGVPRLRRRTRLESVSIYYVLILYTCVILVVVSDENVR